MEERNYLIKKIEGYDAGKMSNQQLADDWRYAVMFYAAIKAGGKFKYTKEQVVDVAKKIKHEIDRRVADGKMSHEFNPPSAAGKELLKLLAYTPIFHGTVSRRSSEITLEEVMARLNDFKVRSPLAWIVGSLANWERTDGDVDILINASSDEPLFKVMNFRILRAFPQSMRDRIHCLPNDDRMGPFTSCVPIYELCAVAGKRERFEMKNNFSVDSKKLERLINEGIKNICEGESEIREIRRFEIRDSPKSFTLEATDDNKLKVIEDEA